jgi:hypothetical protein
MKIAYFTLLLITFLASLSQDIKAQATGSTGDGEGELPQDKSRTTKDKKKPNLLKNISLKSNEKKALKTIRKDWKTCYQENPDFKNLLQLKKMIVSSSIIHGLTQEKNETKENCEKPKTTQPPFKLHCLKQGEGAKLLLDFLQNPEVDYHLFKKYKLSDKETIELKDFYKTILKKDEK